MKNQITIVMLVLTAFTQMAAQKIKEVNNPSITSWGTSFTTPTTDPKWSNRNGTSYTKAKYADYTGETAVGMKSSIETEVTLNLDITLDKGTLQVIMEDEAANVIFFKIFSADMVFTTDVVLQPNKKYKIRFIGLETKGSYFCQWIEKPTNKPAP